MGIFSRSINILIFPKKEWIKIAAENRSLTELILFYIIPLALIGAAASFIGYGYIGVDTGILDIRLKGTDWGLTRALNYFISIILSVVFSAYIIDACAVFTGAEKNIYRTAQLLAYSMTAFMIGELFYIIPQAGFMGILVGSYGIYLLYRGVDLLKKTSGRNSMIFIMMALFVFVVIYGLTNFVVGYMIAEIFGFGRFGEYGRFGF